MTRSSRPAATVALTEPTVISRYVQPAAPPFLYDCAAGGSGCVKLAENYVHVNPCKCLESLDRAGG